MAGEPETTEPADARDECEWCHWRYPASALRVTLGRRLCESCTAAFHGEEDGEEIEE